MAVRLIAREEWEAELRFYGCRPVRGLMKLATNAEWWQMPWESVPFMVPVDSGGRLWPQDLQNRISLITNSAPKGTKFPWQK